MSGAKGVTCHRCGPGHLATQCKFRDRVCHSCGKTGHLAIVCRSKFNSQKKTLKAAKTKKCSAQPVRRVEEESEESSEEDFVHHIRAVKRGRNSLPPIKVQVGVDDCLVSMEVDTGASMSIMGETTFNKLWPGRGLDITDVTLQNY